MTDKQQRQPGQAGANETAILKLIGLDHTGKVVAIQRPATRPGDRQHKVNSNAASPKLAETHVIVGAHAPVLAVTLSGPVVSTSIDNGALTITIVLGQGLPVSLVMPIQSRNAGIQAAGLGLLVKIARAAGIFDMQDTDELIGCEVAVTIRAGVRHD
ncbi:MAG: hypothetical protein NTX56_11950 [Proteobacteria bacterium]|nr:hypothetical protein [Pseudomonadota bacterium]